MKKAAAILLLLLLLAGAALAEPDEMQVHQIYNGCADAYLIRCGEITIIMDAGNDVGHSSSALMDYLRQAGFNRLTAYIVTHYHDDHAANINRILAEFGDDATIVYGPSEVLRSKYEPLAAGVYRQLKDGDGVILGGMVIKCVGPATLESKGLTNRDSLNLLITYGERKFLFTGDYVRSVELMASHRDEVKDIDVLKFPHHGLKPFYIGPQTFRHMNPSIILAPCSAPWAMLQFAKSNGFQGEAYCNGHGHVVVLTDGVSLEVLDHVQPGQLAER